ncbi:hypothetical protein Leryth_008548 [Lithospermum erythrorhizon]|nr:hypothetical protein Leryth_008548 [Lithospermum erythrorhizon]
MSDEEERGIEEELETQLQEQRDSISDIDQALSVDPTNSDLISVREELVQAIKQTEEGLFHLKRERLLREIDSSLKHSKQPVVEEEVKAEPLDLFGAETEPLEDVGYSVGSKCRFRHTDGRWYNGRIIGVEGSHSAKVSFLIPTSENMQMCKFFLQQRCRFGNSCRSSHGIDVPISSLKEYIPMKWEQSLVGSSIWALSDRKAGIWRVAELESWDEKLDEGNVVFRDDGSSAKVGIESLSLSEFAQVSDEEESCSDFDESENSELSDSDGGISGGLGFLESTNKQRGVQSETAIFAKWENHTRGIASKMMANMGYREGMGLGATGQGMVNPIPVKVLPARQSLDHAMENRKDEIGNEQKVKKRSRGGKKIRERKLAAAARSAAEQEEPSSDVFSIINTHLAKHGQVDTSTNKRNKAPTETRKEDRRSLIAYEDQIKELRTRVEKLEEMVSRNRNEKVVYEAAIRKLTETRKALAEAESAQASTSNAVLRKEKEKRWLKF